MKVCLQLLITSGLLATGQGRQMHSGKKRKKMHPTQPAQSPATHTRGDLSTQPILPPQAHNVRPNPTNPYHVDAAAALLQVKKKVTSNLQYSICAEGFDCPEVNALKIKQETARSFIKNTLGKQITPLTPNEKVLLEKIILQLFEIESKNIKHNNDPTQIRQAVQDLVTVDENLRAQSKLESITDTAKRLVADLFDHLPKVERDKETSTFLADFCNAIFPLNNVRAKAYSEAPSGRVIFGVIPDDQLIVARHNLNTMAERYGYRFLPKAEQIIKEEGFAEKEAVTAYQDFFKKAYRNIMAKGTSPITFGAVIIETRRMAEASG